jgi:hypothetical protein
MHKSVYRRFEAEEVVLYDTLGRYRPSNLKNHADFAHYYNNGAAPKTLKAVADDIEARWEKQKAIRAAQA